MARIPNFPMGYLREHATWHRNMDMNSHSGHGIDFLQFHRDYIRRNLNWYNAQGYPREYVLPWTRIPDAIKRHPRWTRRLQEAEDRITRNIGSFRSADELGIFIEESNLHGAVHVLGAEVFNEPDFRSVLYSPRSTYFYNWHGLIDSWWRQYEATRQQRPQA